MANSGDHASLDAFGSWCTARPAQVRAEHVVPGPGRVRSAGYDSAGGVGDGIPGVDCQEDWSLRVPWSRTSFCQPGLERVVVGRQPVAEAPCVHPLHHPLLPRSALQVNLEKGATLRERRRTLQRSSGPNKSAQKLQRFTEHGAEFLGSPCCSMKPRCWLTPG